MKIITLESQAEAIERWKAANGVSGRDYVPVNNGSRRTESKRELLAAMDDSTSALGVAPVFAANY